MTWTCGIDVGAASTKAVLVKAGKPHRFHQILSGHDFKATAQRVLEAICARENLAPRDITRIIATGCGASQVTLANGSAGDLACCALGAHYLLPEARTVIEVGDRGTKVVRINGQGKAIQFVVSERCASGSGRFLTVIARVLQLDIAGIGPLSLTARNPISFATGCAVFGESEAISRVAEGTPKEDILAGVHLALATKIVALADRVRMAPPFAFVGGGALDSGLAKQVEEKIGERLYIPAQPQFAAAMGAAFHNLASS